MRDEPRFCIDWDDTLVEDRWPDQGPWLPGAVDALAELDRHGQIVIYSCRVSRYRFPSAKYPHEDVLRDDNDVARSVDQMRAMLDEAGFPHFEIWTRDYKPAATVYVDNKALRFEGDWEKTLEQIYDLLMPGVGKMMAAPYHELPSFIRGDRHPASERFHAILGSLGRLHDEKQKGYGTDADPLANVRASSDWGMPAWVGAMIRAQDKIKRLQTFAQKGELPFERVEDAFLDLAVYSVIGLILFEQESGSL